MKYIKTEIVGKGKALMKQDDKGYYIVLLVSTPKNSTEEENERLIDRLSFEYLEYLQRIGEDSKEKREGVEE